MGHISIFVQGKPLRLKDDFSISIEESNPYFNEVDMFSYPVEIPIEGNRFLLENMDSPFSSKRATDIERKEMSIYVDGMPLCNGVCHVDEEQSLSDTFSFSVDSMNQSISDIIGDMTCQDVPLIDNIQIGECISNIDFTLTYNRYCVARMLNPSPGMNVDNICQMTDNPTYKGSMELNPLGFSYPKIFEEDNTATHTAKRSNGKPVVKESFINTSNIYQPSLTTEEEKKGLKKAFYINAPVCYKHYKENSDEEVVIDENTGPYYVLPADRPCSGICFFVLYLFKCLFAYIGMEYDESELMEVDGLRRLVFYTTLCKFTTEPKHTSTVYDLSTTSGKLEVFNNWASTRAENTNHAGNVKTEGIRAFSNKSVESVTIGNRTYVKGMTLDDYIFQDLLVSANNVKGTFTAKIMKMYASPENFPAMSVSDAISSMFGSFGVKFLYDYNTHKVRARLIRNIYRNTDEPVTIQCHVLSVEKVSEKIFGVRMRYADESDKDEQLENITKGTKDYDTDYDYIDYSNVNLSHAYAWIKANVSSADTTCYIDKNTGNAYRYKIDGDAETAEDMKPVLFEVGGFHGAEWGDCSDENEDYIEDITSNFQPMVYNDVNLTYTKSAAGLPDTGWTVYGKTTTYSWGEPSADSDTLPDQQILCPFMDEDMYHENQEVKTSSPFSDGMYSFSFIQTLTTDESYDPSANDDAMSPLQNYDWGNAIAIMQASGNGPSKVVSSNEDAFGNKTWYSNTGFFTIASDAIDNYGKKLNNTEEYFSLKIKGYKTVKDPQTGEMVDAIDNDAAKYRGLADSFMNEHAHFLLNRHKFSIEILCEPAQLMQITNHWERKYRIGDLTGWVNKISSTVSVEKGLEKVTVELFTL